MNLKYKLYRATQTFSNKDGSRANDEHAATNQQLPSFPCVTSWLLIPSTNSFGGSGAQMSYREIIITIIQFIY